MGIIYLKTTHLRGNGIRVGWGKNKVVKSIAFGKKYIKKDFQR